jgi:hypothetical protein
MRAEPLSGPVERAEKRARGNGGVPAAEGTRADAGGHEASHAAFVPIPFGHDQAAQPGRQGVHFEVSGRSFDLGDETQHVPDGQGMQALGERPAGGDGGVERRQQTIQRSILTEEKDFVLAAEVVIEIAWREIGGNGDVAHARGHEATAPEDLGGSAQNFDAARLGPAF